MALNVDNSGNGNTQQQTERQAQPTRDQAQANQSNRGSVFSFLDTSAILPAPMGQNATSEILTKLCEQLEACYASANKDYIATVTPIDRNNEVDLAFSSIVVAVHPNGNKEKVAFHTLILESSNDGILPRHENIGGQTIEIMRVASDAYDADLLNVIEANLRRQFPASTLVNAGFCVVPNNFRADEKEARAVYKLAANAMLAGFTELAVGSAGFTDINVGNAKKDATLSVRATFGRGENYDAVGLPIRSDVIVELVASHQARNAANQGLNSGADSTKQVTMLSGFMDLIWNPVTQGPNPYAMGMSQPDLYRKYLPRFVITSLAPTRLLTIGAQLLALVSADALREDNTWVNAFRPKTTQGNEADMHDIGAVAIEANLANNPTGYGEKVNTKSDNFRGEQLFQLVGATIQPNLVISMDVPEGGASSWYGDVFAASAKGSMNATRAILEAADTLTDGHFSQFFGNNSRVVMDDNNRIHLGYYMDRNGIMRDIRDVDYLCVANRVGDKDPGAIREWSDTFLRTQYPLAQRLAARKRMIASLTGADPVFTGFAARFTFEREFIRALVAGCKAAGLNIRNTTSIGDATSYERASGIAFASAAMGGESSGMFNREMGMFAGQQFMGNQFSRW